MCRSEDAAFPPKSEKGLVKTLAGWKESVGLTNDHELINPLCKPACAVLTPEKQYVWVGNPQADAGGRGSVAIRGIILEVDRVPLNPRIRSFDLT